MNRTPPTRSVLDCASPLALSLLLFFCQSFFCHAAPFLFSPATISSGGNRPAPGASLRGWFESDAGVGVYAGTSNLLSWASLHNPSVQFVPHSGLFYPATNRPVYAKYHSDPIPSIQYLGVDNPGSVVQCAPWTLPTLVNSMTIIFAGRLCTNFVEHSPLISLEWFGSGDVVTEELQLRYENGQLLLTTAGGGGGGSLPPVIFGRGGPITPGTFHIFTIRVDVDRAGIVRLDGTNVVNVSFLSSPLHFDLVANLMPGSGNISTVNDESEVRAYQAFNVAAVIFADAYWEDATLATFESYLATKFATCFP